MGQTAKHGGNAFPCSNDCRDNEMGMTLRDYFAAQALVGMAANHRWNEAKWEVVAEQAYRAADQMLKARSTSDGV